MEMDRELSIQMTTDAELTTLEHEIRKRVRFQELQRAAMEGDWETAKDIFQQYPDAKTSTVSVLGLTALHVAASSGRSEFVEKLVKQLNAEQLEMIDQVGCTALHHVALAASVRAAEVMVKKSPNLPQIGDMNLDTPLLYAAQWRHPSKSKEVVEYLYKVTRDEAPCYPITGPSATKLILAITASGSHDVSLRLLRRNPDLALKIDENGKSILHVLATQPSAFRVPKPSLLEWSLGQWMRTETKQRRWHSINLVKFVCMELRKKSTSEIMDYFLPANHTAVLQLATVYGAFELVEVCLNYFPDIIWYSSNKRLLLHDAIEHRRVDIFNHMIHLIGENTKAYADAEVDGQNNTLHLAAKLPPSPQLLSVPDPAFQMQRELQWFKAVEALVYDEKRVAKNSDDCTPGELFFKDHEPLLKSAKEWMKNTSNSCMVVATLVATVAFAAMITVPGGNDSGTGIPILSRKKLFVAFSISNAVSMISSAISLLMFLSVQTSRETEEDFLETLPKMLLRGLIFLFIAVATMMIAFGTAIGLSLQKRVNWAYIPITIVACCPVIIFTKMQLPLFFQTLELTSGPGIFQVKTDSKLCSLNKIGSSLLSNDKLL